MLGKSGRSTRAGELGDLSVFLFLWRIKGEKLGAKEKEGKWRWCFQLAARTRIHECLLARIFLTDQICPSSKEQKIK